MPIQGIAGLIFFIALCCLVSENRGRIKPKLVIVGLLLQLTLAFVFIKVPLARDFFLSLNGLIIALEKAAKEGSSLVFGYLGGGELPFKEDGAGSSFVLALRALPIVIVVGAVSSLLFYWRIMPFVIKGLSLALRKTMNIGGAAALAAAANIFAGMVEAPLLVKPYLEKMTRSELFMLMTCGMATVAGTVLALYASILGTVIPEAPGHVLIASIISIPAAIMISQIIVPETESVGDGEFSLTQTASGSMDAVTRGTKEGLELWLNIMAMLIAMVALASLINQILSLLPPLWGETLTLQGLLGLIMTPVMWLTGIPWEEARAAGSLMGIKIVFNELLAYLELVKLPEGTLSSHSRLIMLYSLCGFANFGSLGIMIGGLSVMAPGRRREIARLGLKSIFSGAVTTCMTGTVAGLIAFL